MAATAHGFGADGHRVTGEVARALLTPAAAAALEAISGSADLARLSLVADTERSSLAVRLPSSPRWHYDDRLICHPDLPVGDYCRNGDCASAAIERFRKVLADRRAPIAARAEAVMFLVHLVGDIHQPLHAADNNDRGGNDLRVRLPDGRVLALHAAWDTAFVREALGAQTPHDAAGAWLAARRPSLKDWQAGTVQDWMAESYQRAVDDVYGPLSGVPCDEAPKSPVELSPDYVAHATAMMPELLVEAGMRIARVLNEALDPALHR